MSNPQQPEQRRSDKGGATPQDSGELKARQRGGDAGTRPHGTDKGAEGGGEGGGVPPAQQPDHP
ncbi:hypothetical protein [Streptomyces sp. NRRL B-3648]|uniref:hypothetical protein n=1 Tax=Streptomyces sp. NRRL B-3648 TaxID=1519493 RepID=UPI0006AFBE3F|nr:hypothetical protein [Streptomyces sp. NRRL B-3648]KOX11063.1 hypothetical protein ADL04_01845 [Streptomyces sp. NRRL B-3648]